MGNDTNEKLTNAINNRILQNNIDGEKEVNVKIQETYRTTAQLCANLEKVGVNVIIQKAILEYAKGHHDISLDLSPDKKR